MNVLSHYLFNTGTDHQILVKKVMRYLWRIKDFKLIYNRVENLEIVGYSDLDFGGYVDDYKSTLEVIFMLVVGVIS